MRKLVAFGCVGSPLALGLTGSAVPKLVLIAVVFILNALNPTLGGGSINFGTSSGTLAQAFVNFVAGFFTAGGLDAFEVIVGF